MCLGSSLFHDTNNRIVDDEGREVTGERKAAAEAFLDAQRSGNIFDLGQQRAVPNPVGEAAPPHSIGQARDTVMRRGDPEPEERQPIFRPGDEQPRLTHMTNTENLTFDSQGRAVAEWRGRQITARDVERMSISDAAQAYRDIFGHRAPPNLSAKQALEQELRNARRPE